ncbi:AEC family transporter [Geobacillus thermodenitrificans]|uniref:AEC family transporter n=1 Tax=Geobacillus thermodenitrificans TaxID=33940 RepID=UPI0004A47E47|nr:AEC family transporter [Geobacillus thermodenitrificans]ARA99574.1 transporter [Geobacillus thermodenitrificans]MED3717242.1 AEC family transporter [Geobacillus thermodenitrificans]PJW20977.1 AEC family transporter [Geobacillus thermodenitrificans]
MAVFSGILLQVMVPMLLIVGVGALLHRLFHFDMNTLSKLNMYVLLPVVAFINVYDSELSGKVLAAIFGFLLLQSSGLIVLSMMMAKLFKLERSRAAVFQNTIVLNNSGNFGIPVSQLVFHQQPLGAAIQIVVTIFQNFLTNTYGVYQFVSGNGKKGKWVAELWKNPVLHALLLGVVCRWLHVPVPSFLWTPLQRIADAFLAIALFTLGAQIAYARFTALPPLLYASVFGRLLFSPLLAAAFIFLLGIEGVTAQALLIASSYPCSRNTALYALEYDCHPDYAAQAVLLSTLLSAITVTGVVYVARLLFS